ncbi:MAG: phospholipid/cholesterol/gamma-HCH transport system substrate-binding protein [Thermoleophilaceae bacterium]|jgi:phospholipid/cholesterol/gamma-HCH transport system substrate-binding protein|nr:phospholipid/cholesterol/gamma-HCH transport system substrate-binding protein [Thermoleophilaceae bacterium]
MKIAIQKHLRDFLALFFMSLVALGVTAYILSQERFHLPKWVPAIGSDFYKLNVDFQTGQAVVPGQGQTINIAGVKVGDVQSVHLHNGVAVVSVQMEKRYAPVYRNAHVLLRPKTGLKDMYLALNPGTKDAGALPSGGTIPVANTLPDVNPDEVLSSLDADTRDYLQILLSAGGQAFTDAPGHQGQASADLRQTFKRFEPINRDLAAIMSQIAQRKRNVSHVIHNFRLITDELASTDGTLGRFVESSNANFQAFAAQDANLREALGLLPDTLKVTQATLAKADKLGTTAAPAFQHLRPFARGLGPALEGVRPFLRETTPIIKNQLRPFTRIARPTVRDLRPTAADLAAATPSLRRTFGVLNSLFNLFAYNPPGKEEGFLFWQTWLNHAGATIFNTEDAHGPIRRGLVIVSCGALGVLDNIVRANPQLSVLTQLLSAPSRAQACGQQVPGGPAGDTTQPTSNTPAPPAAVVPPLPKLRGLK